MGEGLQVEETSIPLTNRITNKDSKTAPEEPIKEEPIKEEHIKEEPIKEEPIDERLIDEGK